MRERKGGAQYLCFLFATFIVSSSEVPLGRRRAAGEPAPRGERTAMQLSAPAPTQREAIIGVMGLSGPSPLALARTANRARGLAATLCEDLLPVRVLPSGLVRRSCVQSSVCAREGRVGAASSDMLPPGGAIYQSLAQGLPLCNEVSMALQIGKGLWLQV